MTLSKVKFGMTGQVAWVTKYIQSRRKRSEAAIGVGKFSTTRLDEPMKVITVANWIMNTASLPINGLCKARKVISRENSLNWPSRKPCLPGQRFGINQATQSVAKRDGFEHQHGQPQRKGGQQHGRNHIQVQAGTQGKEEQHQIEIPQGFEADGDELGDGIGGHYDASNKGTDFIGQTYRVRQLCNAQTPGDGEQKNVFLHPVETAEQSQ